MVAALADLDPGKVNEGCRRTRQEAAAFAEMHQTENSTWSGSEQ